MKATTLKDSEIITVIEVSVESSVAIIFSTTNLELSKTERKLLDSAIRAIHVVVKTAQTRLNKSTIH